MAQTCAQIVARACQIAKCPGFTQQGGQSLNLILDELAETYDFDSAKKTFSFNFDPGLNAFFGAQNLFGSGPYDLPADYLRSVKGDVMWYLQGVPYVMVPIDLAEFDAQVQQAGLQTYPYWFCTDMSPIGEGNPPQVYIYPPPSGAYPCNVRYRAQPLDINTPEGSAAVPWFPFQNYLVTRLSGELMKDTGDSRAAQFLGDGPNGAQGMLNRYLKLADDKSNRSQRVTLDRRRFGPRYSSLPNTKTVGW